MHGRVRHGLTIAATVLLTACGGGETADEPVASGGEVLEGTASDAMLPLATVTSQPPLAPPEPETSNRVAAGAPTDAASPAPGATPAPELTSEPSVPSVGAAPE